MTHRDEADSPGEESTTADQADSPGEESTTADQADSPGKESTTADQADSGVSVSSGARRADESSGAGRHDRVTRHPTPGTGNSLMAWTDAKHPLRIVVNYVFVVAARHSPSLRLKNWLLRRIGVDVGTGVAWGLESTPDVFWPELITVEDDAIIGYDATLLCHEFLQDEYRTGEIHVGERAMIGAGAIVLPGVHVGQDAQVAANSLVADDVPPNETWAGVPAERVDREDIVVE